MGKLWVITKKIFSVSLVFNVLLTICIATSILVSYYWTYHNWRPFGPYLLSGNLFWIAIAAAIINIFPSAALGRSLHTGRILFHHYFYGFIVLVCAAVYVVLFSPVPLFTLFFVFNESIQANIGRFFILGGLALVLDDLPDVSKHLESALNGLKAKVGQHGRFVSVIQLFCGAVSFYMFAAVIVWMYFTPNWITLANSICAGTLFITGITSIIFVKRKVWLKIKP